MSPSDPHPGAASAVLDPACLDALARTGLLDTDPEPAFDGLTGLTARVTSAPVSLVALVDRDRSFFKSAHGVPEVPPGRSVPLSHSLCQHVVAQGAPLRIDDARADPLVCDNGGVTDLGVGAYLGVPVRSPSGDVVGSLCAIDTEARAWTEDDVASLVAAAAAAQGEIARRAEAEARTEAERMARLQRAFLQNMSHEIRTPLTAILGSADLLAHEAPGDLRGVAASIRSGGQRLMGTLNAVLDLAQIEGDQMAPRPRPTDAVALVVRAARAVAPLAEAKGLGIEGDLPSGLPSVALDPDLLGRALDALLDNAVKFTDAGAVTVRVHHDGGVLRVAVEDTGVGVAAGDRDRIFAPFAQASDGDARTHEGSGLGLAVVAGVVGLMGGEVSVEGAPGEGSRFEVAVPAPPADAA